MHPILPVDVKDMLDEKSHLADDYLKLTDDGLDEAFDEEHFTVVLNSMRAVRKQMQEMAMENIQKAQARYKKDFDARHNTNVKYEVGDHVFLEDPRQEGRKGKGGKLSKRSGPYEIVTLVDDCRLILKNLKTKVVLKVQYNMEHLIPCKTLEKETADDKETEEDREIYSTNGENMDVLAKKEGGRA